MNSEQQPQQQQQQRQQQPQQPQQQHDQPQPQQQQQNQQQQQPQQQPGVVVYGVGDRVDAQFHNGGGEWTTELYPGVITLVDNTKGCVSITHDDGDKVTDVPFNKLKLIHKHNNNNNNNNNTTNDAPVGTTTTTITSGSESVSGSSLSEDDDDDDDVDTDDEQIEKLVDHRVCPTSGMLQYQVHWLDSPSTDDEWFDRDQLMDEYKQLVHDYDNNNNVHIQ